MSDEKASITRKSLLHREKRHADKNNKTREIVIIHDVFLFVVPLLLVLCDTQHIVLLEGSIISKVKQCITKTIKIAYKKPLLQPSNADRFDHFKSSSFQ